MKRESLRPQASALHGARALLVAVAAWIPAGCAPGETSGPPDVLFVLIDTLRADRLSCYGYPRPTSPRIDALAEGGVLFEDVTSQASWTMPSMA